MGWAQRARASRTRSTSECGPRYLEWGVLWTQMEMEGPPWVWSCC